MDVPSSILIFGIVIKYGVVAVCCSMVNRDEWCVMCLCDSKQT
jgi:hypothetical protein